ncbi:DUF4097 domain-containing protein (plasmid) [Streptomyces sp. NBC_01102]|uniref:DUF4097 family beta strand repeat-containing protein n=1 Tax=Streptomyces sp. NBC_01102 TaxID=2903749 RepID=UPI00386E1E7F|nr:DUF4097 domain-containing protein [Streptomyces sp. NBC_01102]
MATTRTLTAEQSGPITIDAELLGLGGIVMVRTKRTIKNAEITIRTADDSGDSADAVRAAALRWDQRGALVAHVRGKGGGSNSQTVIIGGSTVEIEAVVPEGSMVIGRTDSADMTADGTLASVSGSTQSGDVTVGDSPNIVARTQSGDVRLGRTDVVDAHTMSGDIKIKDFGGTAKLKTMSGDIDVHATAGGDIDAKTMSGDIEVTATQAALDDSLDVRPHTMSGDIRVPRRQNTSGGPRRRRS